MTHRVHSSLGARVPMTYAIAKPRTLDIHLKQVTIVVLDIDGTILTSDNKIQSGLGDVCKILHKHGVIVLLASARPVLSILNIADDLGISGKVVGLNGSIIADKETIYHQAWFNTESILSVLARFSDISINYYVNYDWFVGSKDSNILLEEKLAGMDAKIIEANIDVSKVQKILVIGSRVSLEAIKARLLMNQEIECHFSKNNYLEINPRGIGKWAGVEHGLRIMEAHAPYVMAIGDGENDIPMLSGAQFGVSMGNAPEIVQNAAKHVIGTNDSNGLTDFLRYFCTIRDFC